MKRKGGCAMRISLVTKNRGVSKKGREFGRVCLKFKSERGSAVKDFFVAPAVLERSNAQEDDEVECVLGFDEYGRTEIKEIRKVDNDDVAIFGEEE
jgi:hypothetical protein